MVGVEAVRPINEIIVHCTATPAAWMDGKPTSAKVSEVRLWHTRDRGWKDIGYHFLIDRDGTIAKGRPLEQIGAHVQGHNTGTIGISLIGGHGSFSFDPFAKNFTPQQDRAARMLIADLRARFPDIRRISGHNEYAAKACPGFSVAKWLAASPEAVTKPQTAPPKPQGFVTKPSWLAALIRAILSVFKRS